MQEACLRSAPSHVNAFAWYIWCVSTANGGTGAEEQAERFTPGKNEEAEAPIMCDGHRVGELGQFLRNYYSTKEKGSQETNWGDINKEVWNNIGGK